MLSSPALNTTLDILDIQSNRGIITCCPGIAIHVVKGMRLNLPYLGHKILVVPFRKFQLGQELFHVLRMLLLSSDEVFLLILLILPEILFELLKILGPVRLLFQLTLQLPHRIPASSNLVYLCVNCILLPGDLALVTTNCLDLLFDGVALLGTLLAGLVDKCARRAPWPFVTNEVIHYYAPKMCFFGLVNIILLTGRRSCLVDGP